MTFWFSLHLQGTVEYFSLLVEDPLVMSVLR